MPNLAKWKGKAGIDFPEKGTGLYLWIAVVTLVSVVINGYQANSTDLMLYLSYLPIYKGYNPYHPIDLLMLAKVAGCHYYTFGIFPLLLLKQCISLPLACFGIHLVCQYFIFLMFYYLVLWLSGKKEIAWLALGLLIFKKMVAGTPVGTLEDVFSVRSIALPMLFLSLLYYAKGKPWRSFLLAGFAGNFHLLSSGLVMGVLFISSLLGEERRKWRQTILMSMGYMGCLAPLLYWRFSNYSQTYLGVPLIADSEWLRIVHARAPYLFISQWGPLSLLSLLAMAVIILLLLMNREKIKLSPVFTRMTLAVLIISLVSIILTQLEFSPAISFQSIRSIWYLNYFLMIGIAWMTYYYWKDGSEVNRMLVLILYICWVFPLQRWGLILSMIPAGLLILNHKDNLLVSSYGRKAFLSSVVFGMTFLGVFVFGSEFKYGINMSEQINKFVAHMDIYGKNTEKYWIDVQLWAKENTPPGSLFITPPDKVGFRYYSERSPLVENKDGAMSVYSQEYAREWDHRMKALGILPRCDARYYGKIYDQLPSWRLIWVGSYYGADYLVVRNSVHPGMKLLYQNPEYSLYRMSPE